MLAAISLLPYIKYTKIQYSEDSVHELKVGVIVPYLALDFHVGNLVLYFKYKAWTYFFLNREISSVCWALGSLGTMLVLHCCDRVLSTTNLKAKWFTFAHGYEAVSQFKLSLLLFGLWQVRNIMIEKTRKDKFFISWQPANWRGNKRGQDTERNDLRLRLSLKYISLRTCFF